MIIIGFAYDLITELFTSRAGEGVGAGERARDGEGAVEYAGKVWGMWMARGMLGIRDLALHWTGESFRWVFWILGVVRHRYP